MAQNTRRNKRRGPVKDAAKAPQQPTQDRYQKFLPEWMRGTNGAPPPRPRPRRARPARPARPAGGYTPGKLAMGDALLDA